MNESFYNFEFKHYFVHIIPNTSPKHVCTRYSIESFLITFLEIKTVIFFLPIYFTVRKEIGVKSVSKVPDLVSGRVRTISRHLSLS